MFECWSAILIHQCLTDASSCQQCLQAYKIAGALRHIEQRSGRHTTMHLNVSNATRERPQDLWSGQSVDPAALKTVRSAGRLAAKQQHMYLPMRHDNDKIMRMRTCGTDMYNRQRIGLQCTSAYRHDIATSNIVALTQCDANFHSLI